MIATHPSLAEGVPANGKCVTQWLAMIEEKAQSQASVVPGYHLGADIRVWITRFVFVRSRAIASPCEHITANLLELRDAGLLSGQRHALRGPGGGVQHAVRLLRSCPLPVGYKALLEIVANGSVSIDFKMQEVVEEVLDTWRLGAVDHSMIPLLRHVKEGQY